MNIGIVGYPTYGGSGVVATELGKALATDGHKVHFITYSQPPRLDFHNANLFYHEVDVSNYPLFQYPPYLLALASQMVNVAKFQKLDVLHVHYAIPHATAGFLAKQILKTQGVEVPVVTTLHGTDITLVGKDSSYEPIVAFSINESDIVTAVSEDLKKDTLEHFDITNEIKVVPNFIDLSKFAKQKKDHFKSAICANNEKLIVHTSNFRKVKRVDLVVQIFNKILEKTPAKLLLIGDGPERSKTEALCRELGVCDHIRFLGKINAVEEVLSVADLFLMPSELESFGLAALEAMACEVPVVSSNAGGLPELVQPGISGFTSPKGDVDDMVKNALIILKEENLPKFKAGALARAKDFDISKVLSMYVDVYEQAIQKIKK